MYVYVYNYSVYMLCTVEYKCVRKKGCLEFGRYAVTRGSHIDKKHRTPIMNPQQITNKRVHMHEIA